MYVYISVSQPQHSFLHIKALRKVREVRSQLNDIAQQRRMVMQPCGTNNWDVLRKALCAGLFHNAASAKGASGQYAGLRTGLECFLHPTSSLALGVSGEYVIYQELVLTSKEYMRTVTIVDPRCAHTFSFWFLALLHN